MNCNIEKMYAFHLINCYFKNTTINDIQIAFNENNIEDTNNSFTNFSYTAFIPYPQIDPIMCPEIDTGTNYSNHVQISSIRYTLIKEKMEITNCKLINVSMMGDEGSAISIQQPSYINDFSSPFIKIENILFYRCQSEVKTGCIDINYKNARIEINHVCGIKNSGYYNYLSFNSSTIWSELKNANGMSLAVYSINSPMDDDFVRVAARSYVTGINTTKIFSMYCVYMAKNTSIRYCQEESVLTGFFISLYKSSIEYCNYINTISYDNTDFLKQQDVEDYDLNVIIMNCIFINSTLLDWFKDFYELLNITVINCSGTELINVKSYVLPECKIPDDDSHHKDRKLLIYYSVSVVLFVLIVAIVGFAIYYYRKKQSVIEKRFDLERSLQHDYG